MAARSSTVTAEIPPVDLVSVEATRDPYAVLGDLRRRDPVHWSGRHRAWILTRHADVQAALTDDRLSTDNITPLQAKMSAPEQKRFTPAARMLGSWMLFNNPPVHTALRTPVRSAFTPRSVDGLRRRLVVAVDDLLDELIARGSGDFVELVAFPLPALAIAELLGVPRHAHREFREWSRLLGALVVGKVSDERAWQKAMAAAEGFNELFGELIERYERKPADNLISALVSSSGTGGLQRDQLVGACTMLLFAGHETTTNLIASGVLALLTHPDQRDLIAAQPSVIDTAVEEMVRYDGPAKIVVRRVRSDHDLDGHALRAGQPVFIALAAANRDPDVFDDPESFDVRRDPNRHLGFGWGQHFCLGAHLARVETAVVVNRLLERLPGMQLGCSAAALEWQANIVGRSLKSLPVAVA
jgi:cytochrome P450